MKDHLKINIFCGDSHEEWTPDSEKTGIAGSEEAVINISRELVKLGHEVIVFNRCGDKAGFYDRVEYRNYEDYAGEECDIFIGWRTLQSWKRANPKSYKAGYHWLHDTSPEDNVLQALALGARKVMVLSKYHRRLYPNIRNEEVFLTRNGINPDQFVGKLDRIPGLVVYGSSYDRGLKELLEQWPKIKLAVPHAQLHIFYGWQTWESMMKDQPGDFRRIKEHIEELMNQEGVTHLGRISHDEVAAQYMMADVWGYPTWWPEISCISAMKAQAGGAIPVVIPTAAVAETAKYGKKTDRGYFQSTYGNITLPEGTLEQWTEMLVKVLEQTEEDKTGSRKEMMDWAKKEYSWSKVAKEWEAEFTNDLLDRQNVERALARERESQQASEPSSVR